MARLHVATGGLHGRRAAWVIEARRADDGCPLPACRARKLMHTHEPLRFDAAPLGNTVYPIPKDARGEKVRNQLRHYPKDIDFIEYQQFHNFSVI
jgi:hypothetical protein